MSEFFTVLWNFVCGMGLLGMMRITAFSNIVQLLSRQLTLCHVNGLKPTEITPCCVILQQRKADTFYRMSHQILD